MVRKRSHASLRTNHALRSIVAQRLSTVDMLPELRQSLLQLATSDERWSAESWQWGWVIPTVQSALQATHLPIQPFMVAWTLMYAAIVHLDRLQDRDPIEEPLPGADNTPAHYNALLSYYVVASSLLDDLSVNALRLPRIHRLRRLWADLMLRTASGQQRDLTIVGSNWSAQLETYQELARAKTGSTFALAFAGVATLVTDDQEVTDACLKLGDLFGTLVQYHDDVLDADTQPNRTLTLPGALTQAHPELAAHGRTVREFWNYVYLAHRVSAEQAVSALPRKFGQPLLMLFREAFEDLPDQMRDDS